LTVMEAVHIPGALSQQILTPPARAPRRKEVDHSQRILVFAVPVYFEKINCVKELTRNKQATLLLPDAAVHGVFTQSMINDLVTDEWVQKWKLDRKLAEGVTEIQLPTGADICGAPFDQPPLYLVVALHALPRPHDGAHVPAEVARGEPRHLPAGCGELHTSLKGSHADQGLLQPAQCGDHRARQ
jgi:hypothetical protein